MQIGRYRTQRPIASGGMATVYLGRAEGAEGFAREVAIKVMHPHLATDDEFVAMFLDEARMVSGLRHPNVVPTLDVARDGARLFLVMEYVEGAALNHLLKQLQLKERRMPLPVALRIVLDLLDGLHAAHEQRTSEGAPMNLVHRDVSPHNLLVGTAGVSRIMDFGIARAETRVTSTRDGQLKGKLSYMSPEQLLDKSVDRRSDVYAAGLVLWEILVGRRAFDADNEGALVRAVLEGATTSPHELEPSVPEPIAAQCMRALARDPTERFQTTADFAQALEEAARQAQVGIATPREVAAFCAELPRPPAYVESDPDASPMASASAVQVVSQLRGVRSRGRDLLLAAVAASLVTGGAVFLATRTDDDAEPGSEGIASSAPTPTASASADTTAAPRGSALHEPVTSASAASDPAPSTRATAPLPPPAAAPPAVVPPPPWRPPPPPPPDTFRPEEP